MISEKRTVIVKDVDLYYAKLKNPVKPFGELRWELQMRTSDEATADEWKKEYELNVKKVEDYWKVNVTRPLLNKNKEENDAPQVVDSTRSPISGDNIGNGSKGNVKLFQYPYDVAGRKGTGSMLSGVQVTNLIEYVPDSSIDFDVLEDTASKEASF